MRGISLVMNGEGWRLAKRAPRGVSTEVGPASQGQPVALIELGVPNEV
jgi:hypothetical protein